VALLLRKHLRKKRSRRRFLMSKIRVKKELQNPPKATKKLKKILNQMSKTKK
jgi:hypothetical protein